MADHTSIEWTDATWNPITGCSVVSPGCTNCYAMRLAGTRLRHHPSRSGLTSDSKAGPVWNGEVRLNEGWLTQPLLWTRPRQIFVCAHGDLFHTGGRMTSPQNPPRLQEGRERPVRLREGGREAKGCLSFTFDKPGTFQAMYAAEDFLRILGFSLGSNQSRSPRGILFGNFLIAKWRNLSPAERAALHGRMTGDMRAGPVIIRFADNLPAEALEALAEGPAPASCASGQMGGV